MKHGYIIFMPKYAKIDSPLKIIGTFSEREKNGIPCYYHEETHTHYAKSGKNVRKKNTYMLSNKWKGIKENR